MIVDLGVMWFLLLFALGLVALADEVRRLAACVRVLEHKLSRQRADR